MRKIAIGLLALGILTGPALAQRGAQQPSPEDMQRKREAAELDQQYKDALKRSSATTAAPRVDPWANMRSGGTEPKR